MEWARGRGLKWSIILHFSSDVSICITLAAIKFWGLNAKNKMILLFSCIIMKNHVLVVIVSYSARAGITKSIIYYTF